VTSDDYVVFVAPVPPIQEKSRTTNVLTKLAFDVLARHAPAPWELIAQKGDDQGARMEHALGTLFERGATYALLAGSDARRFHGAARRGVLDDALGTSGEVLLGRARTAATT